MYFPNSVPLSLLCPTFTEKSEKQNMIHVSKTVKIFLVHKLRRFFQKDKVNYSQQNLSIKLFISLGIGFSS